MKKINKIFSVICMGIFLSLTLFGCQRKHSNGEKQEQKSNRRNEQSVEKIIKSENKSEENKSQTNTSQNIEDEETVELDQNGEIDFQNNEKNSTNQGESSKKEKYIEKNNQKSDGESENIDPTTELPLVLEED